MRSDVDPEELVISCLTGRSLMETVHTVGVSLKFTDSHPTHMTGVTILFPLTARLSVNKLKRP